ncbi:hypothetical protein ALQ17_200021 [Pseudomonas fluorescens]|nr:hypothetical protein ALQ17_200021 [Pseudomonas fluorescens]
MLLAARKLFRVALEQIPQAQALDQLRLPLGVKASRQPRLERQVVLDPQAADQVELLKHQADFGTPPMRQLRFAQLIQALLAHLDAAAIHPVEPGHQVQQGALAATRLAHQRQAAALAQVQIDTGQHRQRPLGGGIAFDHTLHLQHDNTRLMGGHRE